MTSPSSASLVNVVRFACSVCVRPTRAVCGWAGLLGGGNGPGDVVAIVAKNDRAINPDLERSMYKRAGSTVTELASSHVVYISHPAEVAAVIEQAAK